MSFLFGGILSLIFLTGVPLGIWAFARSIKITRNIQDLRKEVYKLQKNVLRLEDHIRLLSESDLPEDITTAPAQNTSPDAVQSEPVDNDVVIEAAPDDTGNDDHSERAQSIDNESNLIDEDDTAIADDVADLDEEPVAVAAQIEAPQKDKDTESTIGGKISVWIGGVTMALGSLFLVLYAIESGLLSPTIRIASGIFFGFGLCCVGEFTRRRGQYGSVAGYEWANVPAILTAIGTFAMFAAVFAAHALYDLIGPVAAFFLLGLLAMMTMVAALLHGPGLAAGGLLSAFLVPFLITSSDTNILSVAIYVIAIGVAAIVIARVRLWLWLALLATSGMLTYAFLFEIAAASDERLIVLGYLIVALMVTVMSFVTTLYKRDVTTPHKTDWVATIMVSLFALPWLYHNKFVHNTFLDGLDIALLAGLPFVLAFFYPAVRFVLFLPVLVAVLGYLDWDVPRETFSILQQPEVQGVDSLSMPEAYKVSMAFSSFTWAGIFFLFSAFFSGVGGSLKSVSRAPIASASLFMVLSVFVILYARLQDISSPTLFALFAFGFFIAFRAYGEFISRRLASFAHGRSGTIASWLVSSLIAIALAFTIYFDDAALTVSLGLMVPAFAVTYWQHPLKVLRVLTPLSIIPYILRLLDYPFITNDDLGTTPVFNALTYGYGLPALGCVFSALILITKGRDFWSHLMQAFAICGVVITVAMVALHIVDPSFRFDDNNDRLLATAIMSLVGGGVSLGLLRLSYFTQDTFFSHGATVLSFAGIAIGAAGLFVFANPLITGASVGTGLVFNSLSFAYGLPSVLFGLVAWVSWNVRPAYFVYSVLAFALLLATFFVNLTIHHVFNRDDLQSLILSEAEQYTYSVVWLLIGIAVLLSGLFAASRVMRAASGIIIAGVVLKVFLVDMSALEGILRAISFISLGGVLIGIGYFYQYILARGPMKTS